MFSLPVKSKVDLGSSWVCMIRALYNRCECPRDTASCAEGRIRAVCALPFATTAARGILSSTTLCSRDRLKCQDHHNRCRRIRVEIGRARSF